MWNLVIAVQNQQRWHPGDSQWHLSSLLPQFRSTIHLPHPILLLLSFIISQRIFAGGVYVCLIWLCYDAGSENRSGAMLLRRPHHGRSPTPSTFMENCTELHVIGPSVNSSVTQTTYWQRNLVYIVGDSNANWKNGYSSSRQVRRCWGILLGCWFECFYPWWRFSIDVFDPLWLDRLGLGVVSSE